MSRESVRITFLFASLNDLYIFACDIGNAYLNDKYREKIWTESGTEFGTENGMLMIIERALYGRKSSVAAWRGKLEKYLMSLGYKYSDADSGVWMKRDFKPNGHPYYNYMLCYVYGLLHIGYKPKKDMDVLNMIYWLKEVFGPPD